MKAFTYIKQGVFGFTEKENPILIDEHDAIVKVTMTVSVPVICISSMVLFLVPFPELLWDMKWWVS